MNETHMCLNLHSPAPSNMCGIVAGQRTDKYLEVTCRACANAIVVLHLKLYTDKKSTLQDLCQVVALSDLLKDVAQAMLQSSLRSDMSKYLVW